MKKFQNSCFMVMFILTFIFFSCNKTDVITSPDLKNNSESDTQKLNEATWTCDNNSKSWFLKLLFLAGHTIDKCGGKCVKIFGEYGHIDCRGFGDACANAVAARLEMDENGYYLVLTDPDALGEYLEFDFPDRSLFITNPQNNTDLWLNIQEQVLSRESFELPFIIHEVWFSENPELENL